MRTLLSVALFLISLPLLDVYAIKDKSSPQLVVGDWSGILNAGLMELTLVLHIAQDHTGKLSATMDSLEQGAKGIVIDSITLTGDQLRFEIHKIQASFEGSIDSEGKSLKGIFTQGQRFELEFTRETKVAQEIQRPQTPREPFFYQQQEVQFENKPSGVTLAGTLALPRGRGPFAAVILIQGSGPIDRDESILGHKPFWVLTNYLANYGIAVLRFDKRGIEKSGGNYHVATTEDFASDVEAAMAFLMGHPKINTSEIGLIGHSEGGLIAPMVAARTNAVAFMVLLAGTGVTGEEILLEQGALLQRAEGLDEEYIAGDTRFRRQILQIAKKQSDPRKAETELKAATDAYFRTLTPLQKKNLGKVTKEDLERNVLAALSPWLRFFLVHEPATALRQIKIPVLALNGELDLQVSPKQNLPPINSALNDAGNIDFLTFEIPRLNHLFQTAQTGSMSEYAKIEETIAPIALETMSDWIFVLKATHPF